MYHPVASARYVCLTRYACTQDSQFVTVTEHAKDPRLWAGPDGTTPDTVTIATALPEGLLRNLWQLMKLSNKANKAFDSRQVN